MQGAKKHASLLFQRWRTGDRLVIEAPSAKQSISLFQARNFSVRTREIWQLPSQYVQGTGKLKCAGDGFTFGLAVREAILPLSCRAGNAARLHTAVLECSSLGHATCAGGMYQLRQMLRPYAAARHFERLATENQGRVRGFWGHLEMGGTGSSSWNKGYYMTPLAKAVAVASLACTRSQVVPRMLALMVGEATWAHRNTCQAESMAPSSLLTSMSVEPPSLAVVINALVMPVVEALVMILRTAYLIIIFSPALMLAPFADPQNAHVRKIWLRIVHRSLELAGAAFIKWGQWAATRPDLFPRDLCKQLQLLQTKAPAHSFAQTKKIIEGAFRMRLSDIFEDFDEEPIASGSIAQVHRAVLQPRLKEAQGFNSSAAIATERGNGGRGRGRGHQQTVVAVKVRHPGVSTVIRRDFAIISIFAQISSFIPGLQWLRLDESIQQFEVFMLTQVDLAREASHLSRFIYNFRSWKDVSFPRPLYPLVHPAVLVETFETGESVARFVERADERRDHINTALAHIGTHTLLKMLLVDNFIHADLHPGNILVRVERGKSPFKRRPHVVLLDVGMTAELAPKDRTLLVNFFKAIARQDGREAATCTLQFSRDQTCPDREAFIRDVEGVFQTWKSPAGADIPVGDCMKELLEQVRRHRVNIDGDVCTVIVTTLVLEGWQRKLDPDLNIMDTLRAVLFKSTWATSLSDTIDGLMAA